MRLQNLVALIVVAAAVVYALFGRGDVTIAPRTAISASDATSAPRAVADASLEGRILVHVSGAVAAPGVVSLESGARVVDAIAAAGGAVRGAELALVNLVSPLRDGDHVVIPAHGDPTIGPTTGTDPTTDDSVVRINTASAGELLELPGIGPVLADRIVRHRETNGPFVEIEDLLDVTGIGESRLAELRELISL